MAIQKKSLISSLNTTKKAIVASSTTPTQTPSVNAPISARIRPRVNARVVAKVNARVMAKVSARVSAKVAARKKAM